MDKNQSGQMLLAVILVMVVALTVGLSVAVRTTTNIRTSTEEENSQRAFSAAEAGIEQALVNPSVTPSPLSNNTSYTTTACTLAGVVSPCQSSGSGFLVNNGSTILKDDSVDIWLSHYPDYTSNWTGSLNIYWGNTSDVCNRNESNNTMAALEIVIISGSKANPTVSHYTFDPCTTLARGGSSGNNFSPTTAGGIVNGTTFAYKATIPVTSGLIARILPLYAPTSIGVQNASGDPAFPAQGTIVSSTGTSDTTKRKIVSFQGYPKLPTELFPFIVFSP